MADPFTVIRGGRLLDAAMHRAGPADILIEGGTIREIGPPGMAAPDGATVVDAAWRLLMPGLVNRHCHSHGGPAQGLGRRLTLQLLLYWGPAANRHRDLQGQDLSGL